MGEYKPPTTKLSFQSDNRYHVFLSFRGPDVRKTLVDHLFQALSAAGLNVFLDSEKLEKGEIIGLSLDRAIESSAIRIPIFSKGYADSTWCLREATAMLRSPGLIIPLFYHVDPTDVRYPEKESSPYKQSFLKHYGHSDRYSREEIDEWKRALQEICSRSGWTTDITQGFEGRLVKMVVNDLIKTLDRVPLEVASHPVGIDSVKNALIHKLNLNSRNEVIKIGIWGVGGIGKTTVAKAVYNQIYADFDAASFVFNVRATTADFSGLTNLQEQILEDLTKYEGKVHNVDQGIALFRDRLGGKCVLLVFDDVDTRVQLNALLGDWLARGSRVIITSRNRHILNVAQVPSECIQEIDGLEINESLQLFSWHAFLKGSPSPSYEDLSRRIVEACKGHPLSLEVIGSFLYDKKDDIGCWTEALHNIALNPDIHEILKISYNDLSDEEKEIFLDIACYFIGEHKIFPISFWKSLQYEMVDTAVSTLSMKLLIKIDDKGLFDMHDHLRDMGLNIARKERERTRLWEAAHLNTVSNNISFSRLRFNGGNPQRLAMLCIPGLRYLHLQNLPVEGMSEDLVELPASLIWLRLEHCPSAIGMNRGIMMTRHSRLVGSIQQLKIMQLKFCDGINGVSISSLFSLPNIQLEHLDLKWCINLNNLPDTIGNLSQLQHLSLRGCSSLNNISDAIGNLSRLQYLDLQKCEGLNNLPDTIGNLSKVQQLDLRKCKNLNALPDTIGNLSQLHHLKLKWCKSLSNLPDTIGNLSQLQHLDLGWCESLKNLPNTIGNLSQLRHLNLGWCDALNKLPDTIGNLTQLRLLDLRGCKNLDNLLEAIGNLSQLQQLDLGWCGSLNNLPYTIGNLTQLQHLDLRGCRSLKNLPDTIGNLSQLLHLDLGWCINLTCLPDTIGNLLQLQQFNLKGCRNLNHLPPAIGALSRLQHLSLAGCVNLKNFP